jgi:hypothetical protein
MKIWQVILTRLLRCIEYEIVAFERARQGPVLVKRQVAREVYPDGLVVHNPNG